MADEQVFFEGDEDAPRAEARARRRRGFTPPMWLKIAGYVMAGGADRKSVV